MNIKILAAGIMLVLPVCRANAAIGTNCTKTTCPSDISMLPMLPTLYECALAGTKECYKSGTQTYVFYPCLSCSGGLTLTNVAFPQCGSSNYIFKSCDCVCNNCDSDTVWTNLGTGYMKKVLRSCDCSSGTATCETITNYQCAAGYYGSSINGTSGCGLCPTWKETYTSPDLTGVPRGTSLAGATAITGCYIAPGTYYDETGAFKISSNCPYTN